MGHLLVGLAEFYINGWDNRIHRGIGQKHDSKDSDLLLAMDNWPEQRYIVNRDSWRRRFNTPLDNTYFLSASFTVTTAAFEAGWYPDLTHCVVGKGF